MSIRGLEINPRLIKLLSGLKTSDIPKKPGHSLLPGTYVTRVTKKIKDIPRVHPSNIMPLVCNYCGHMGKYDLGMILVDHTKYLSLLENIKMHAKGTDWQDPMQQCIYTLGYFRCNHCNGAGDWKLTEMAIQEIQKYSIMALLDTDKARRRGFAYGNVCSDGGKVMSNSASETEDHYLRRLTEKPEDPYLWNRLGNVYYKGGRPDLAVAVFEKSLQYDPEQVESLFSLGIILFGAKEHEEAYKYLRRVLIFARNYRQMQVIDLREILAETLRIITIIFREPEKILAALPMANDFLSDEEIRQMQGDKGLNYVEFIFNSEDSRSLYPLAESYMAMLREELPSDERTLEKHVKRKINAHIEDGAIKKRSKKIRSRSRL